MRLPDGVAERIDALLRPGRRAEFIRDAVLAELERRETTRSKPDPAQSPKPDA